MPCRDSFDGDNKPAVSRRITATQQELQKKLDATQGRLNHLTQMVCAHMRKNDVMGILEKEYSPELVEWYRKHTAADKAREAWEALDDETKKALIAEFGQGLK